jgi:hypothetical protein
MNGMFLEKLLRVAIWDGVYEINFFSDPKLLLLYEREKDVIWSRPITANPWSKRQFFF